MLMYPNAPLLYLYVLIFPNGKRYVGTSKDWKRRWRKGGFGRRARTPVQKAILHFGIDNVKKLPLAYGERVYILEMECRAIAEWSLTDRCFGYNCTLGGEESPMRSPLVTAKRTATITGKPATELQRAAAKLRSNTPEAKARMAVIGKEVFNRPEVRSKIALIQQTPEYRELRRRLATGRFPSEETRIKLRIARKTSGAGPKKGHVWKPEDIAAQTAGRVGGKRSKKTKAKMSKSIKNHWANLSALERERLITALCRGQRRRWARVRAERELVNQ